MLQDEERMGLMQQNSAALVFDEAEVPAEQLADEQSCFIDCEGVKIHYRVQQPEVIPQDIQQQHTSHQPRCKAVMSFSGVSMTDFLFDTKQCNST